MMQYNKIQYNAMQYNIYIIIHTQYTVQCVYIYDMYIYIDIDRQDAEQF